MTNAELRFALTAINLLIDDPTDVLSVKKAKILVQESIDYLDGIKPGRREAAKPVPKTKKI